MSFWANAWNDLRPEGQVELLDLLYMGNLIDKSIGWDAEGPAGLNG